MGSLVLFRQIRPGLQGARFALLKVSTMDDVGFAKGTFGA
jgi:hypothetical protein